MATVLVVDDTAIFRDPIVVTLSRAGVETISASNGQEALDVLKTRAVDLILLDVTMPVMDGLTCLREVRKDARMKNVPVIMLSAMSEREVIVQAAKVGVQGYLLKSSFSRAHLLEMIAKFLPMPSESAAVPPRAPVTLAPVIQNPPSANDNAKKNSSFLKQIVDKIRLRSISPVLQQVLILAESRNTGTEDLVVMIRQDPALALRVLKIANSSFYGSAKRVQNLTEAAQRLGTEGIRNAAAAVSAIDHFGDATSCGLTPQRFWEHSLATATLAQSIAESVRMEEPEKLFLTGMALS
jgi:CheY-like chemotaxis protein